MNSAGERSEDLSEAIAEARALARQEVAEAWQMHLDRIFAERFAEVERKLLDRCQSAMAARARETTQTLNSLARRLRQAESREEAARTLVDEAGGFCGRAALFSITPKGLRLEVPSEDPQLEVALGSAPAFANAVESKDTVVAAGTPGELSREVSAALGQASEKRVYLLPVVHRGKAVAVLYAAAGRSEPDVSALELLAALAAPVLAPEPRLEPGPLVRIEAPAAAPAVPKPSWADLPRSQQEVHLRAQRFARTRVADLVLNRSADVREGRSRRDLYGVLRNEIDAARSEFRRNFYETCPSMVDYLHLELVRTLAQEDPGALGRTYPGPVVWGGRADDSSGL